MRRPSNKSCIATSGMTTAGAVVEYRISEGEAQRRHRGERNEACQEHVHVAGAADDEAGENADRRRGEEHVIQIARVIHRIQGITPHTALTTTCMTTSRPNQPCVRSWPLLPAVSRR